MRALCAFLLPVLIAVALPAAGAEVFSGSRAMDLLRWQCALGPRTPGSEAHAVFRREVAAMADSLGWRLSEDRFSAITPLDGVEREFINLVISLGPSSGPRIWFGAHYDCRLVADQDPVAASRSLPVLGANDGASGTAVLLHLAELLTVTAPPLGVDLLLFDGEDQGVSGRPTTYCLGSEHLAAGAGTFGSPLSDAAPLGLIVVDMVGESGVRIPMEPLSLQYAGVWTRTVFERAGELGLGAFVPAPGRSTYDDHVPFLRRGIPAVDLIDFEYAAWHTADDSPENCSAASLEQVGTLLLDLVRRPPMGGF